MDHKASSPSQGRNPFHTWGFWAVVTGAAALIMVLILIFGPMTEPRPSAGEQIGQIAGEIKRSAWRTFLGLREPTPEPQPVPITDYLQPVAPILGVIAVVLALISGVRRENWRYSVYATGLGASAVVFHYFWWVALLFAGVVILVAIIENMGDIFSFWG